MAFTATPVDGSTSPIPMSSAVPDGTNTPLAVEGGPSITTGGNTLVPVSMYVKDGNNVVEGVTTDAAVVGDNTGTISAKLRGLTKMFNDVWDSVNHRFHVNVDNVNANGQTTMANSAPVVIASDQTLKVKGDTLAIAMAGTGVVNGVGTFLVPATDVTPYKWGSLTINGTFTLTFQIQSCDTNVDADFNNGIVTWFNHGSQTTAQNIAATNTYVFPITDQWLRIKCTAYTSNTSLAGTLNLYTVPPPIQHHFASQTGAWTVGTQVADVTLMASSAQTTTQTYADQTNNFARGVRVVLDMTTVGTGSVTLQIDAKDGASGKYINLLTGAAVTTNSTNLYIVHPDLTAAANLIAKDILPRTWRVKVVANNANSATYSVGASYLV